MMETPLLVNTNVSSFEEYISSLATTGKKNYKYTLKHNSDLTYNLIQYDSKIVHFFMALWQQQLIRGEKRQWGFPPEHIHRMNQLGIIDLFAGYTEDKTILSIQFVERFGNYVYCHPPLYDKNTTNDRYMGKYMWFNLIKHYINNSEVEWVDFGAGYRGTWVDLIKNREQYKDKMAYKWLYVPKQIKQNPDSQLPYVVAKEGYLRKLVIQNEK